MAKHRTIITIDNKGNLVRQTAIVDRSTDWAVLHTPSAEKHKNLSRMAGKLMTLRQNQKAELSHAR